VQTERTKMQPRGRCLNPLSVHHDISTVMGEEVVLFTLAESLQFREVKKKSNFLPDGDDDHVLT